MQNNESKPRGRWTLALLAFVVGMAAMVSVGLAIKGTDQAVFCASCHVMSEVAWTHKQSIHAALDCNECHTPHNLVEKLPFKAAVGMHDIYANSFEDVANVIHANKDTKNVVQENCRRCHVSTTMSVAMDAKPYCTDCHRAVPHNSKLPIDRRKAADV